MDKQRVAGAVKKATGTVKKAAGKAKDAVRELVGGRH